MISDKELQEIKRVSKIRWDLNTAENTLPKILPWLISCVSTIEELKGEVERLKTTEVFKCCLAQEEIINDLRAEVERYRTALHEIIPYVEVMQEVGESESIRYNSGNLILRKINEALGDSHDHVKKKCMACNVTGIYDSFGSPPCDSCNGTGFKS